MSHSKHRRDQGCAALEDDRLAYLVLVFGVHSVGATLIVANRIEKGWSSERQPFPSYPIAE
jgi:hypothetical protein